MSEAPRFRKQRSGVRYADYQPTSPKQKKRKRRPAKRGIGLKKLHVIGKVGI